MALWSHRLVQNSCWVVMRTAARFYVSGQENLPKQGPLLLLANHISHFDPPALSGSTRLVINFMTDRKMLEAPYFGAVLRSLETFPVDRDKTDRKAVKTALERLKAGRVVGVFPEGGIRDGENSILGGAAMPAGGAAMWQMAKCPALVTCIVGTDQLYVRGNWWRRPRIFVRYGKVLEAPDRSISREELGALLGDELKRLYSEIDETYHLTEEEKPSSAQARWAAAKVEA